SVAIRDILGVSISKKKALAKADRSKGIEILSDVALSESTQLIEAIKRSKKDYHISQASGLDEGTGTKPGVLDVPIYDSESKNKPWGDSEDDNGDDNDNDSKGDKHKADSDDDGNSDVDDNERTNLDDNDENPSFTLKDYNEEELDEEYEYDDDNENVFEEEDGDLYNDVDVRLLGAKHEQEIKGDEEMTYVDQNFLKKSHMSKSIIKEESSTQAPFLFTVPQTAILTTTITHDTTVTLTISMITLTTQSLAPITVPTTTLIPALWNFSSLFGFDQRVSTLETELCQLKQADHSTQLLESIKSQFPTMVDDLLSTKTGYATRTDLKSYTKEFEKKAQEERKLYIDVVEKSVKDIIKDEVKSLLPQILPKEVSDFSTPVIQSIIKESLENVVLAKSSSQPKSTYEAAKSLTEFELKNILLDKIKRSTKSQPKSSSKSMQVEEPVFETADTEMLQDQGGLAFNLLKGTCKSFVELEYHFEECYKAVTDQLDWNNPEGHEYPFDLSKSLPLMEAQGCQVVHADYFNNDLEL
nr:hypothetical protein [Tanacetum cinerariifolium]